MYGSVLLASFVTFFGGLAADCFVGGSFLIGTWAFCVRAISHPLGRIRAGRSSTIRKELEQVNTTLIERLRCRDESSQECAETLIRRSRLPGLARMPREPRHLVACMS